MHLDIVLLTDNETDDINPCISGFTIVWQGYDGADYELYLWDGRTITQLTNNTYDDTDPRINGKVIF